MIAYHSANALEIILAVVELGLVTQPQAEVTKLGPHIQPETGGDRDHLAEVFVDLAHDLRARNALVFRDGVQPLFELWVFAQTLCHVARHFVASALKPSLGHIQNNGSLTGDKYRELFCVAGRIEIVFGVEACRHFGHGIGRTRHEVHALGGGAHDGTRAQVAWTPLGATEQIDRLRAGGNRLLARCPANPDRGDHRLGCCRQRFTQLCNHQRFAIVAQEQCQERSLSVGRAMLLDPLLQQVLLKLIGGIE